MINCAKTLYCNPVRTLSPSCPPTHKALPAPIPNILSPLNDKNNKIHLRNRDFKRVVRMPILAIERPPDGLVQIYKFYVVFLGHMA